jgi:N-acetylglucosamine kinase-like BadF-type ATPase
VRAQDGRGPATSLVGMVFGSLGVSSVAELIPNVYERGLPKHRIAALAPYVQQAADGGDAVAQALIEGGARELATAARAVHRQLDFGAGSFPVVLAGGAFKACPGLREPLRRDLALPGAEVRLLDREPATGAVALALDLLRS